MYTNKYICIHTKYWLWLYEIAYWYTSKYYLFFRKF